MGRWRKLTVGVVLSGFVLVPAPALAAGTAADQDSLRWKPCPGKELRGAECGTLTVPVDWRDPGGSGTFDLPVGRIRAMGPASQRIGVLVYNPGGPGAPGVTYLRDVHALLPEPVRERFDLVTWNPRGTEGVVPALAECPFPAIEVPATGPVDWAAVATDYTEARGEALASCFAANSAIAPYLGTWSSVRDIDALRVALGERQLSFWGMSYGTTMGRVYAQTFPNRVRTLLLDGAIDPQATLGSYAREQMWSHAMSMARMLQWFTPGARAMYRRVMAELDQRSLTTSWGAEVTRADVAFEVSDLSGRQFNWTRARTVLRTARDALFAPDPASGAQATDRLADLVDVPRPDAPAESNLDEFVLSFVNCADFPERIGLDEIVTVTDQSARISGIASGMFGLAEATQCAGLPVFGTPIEQRAAIRIPNPPLVLNSVADPYTSLWSATLMANAFAGARLITYDSSMHVTYGRTQSACVNDAVTRFLVDRRLPPRDLACPIAPPFSRRS